MEKLLEQILSLEWWFTVVVVSFLVNILAAFVKQRLDGTISRFSKNRKEKIENEAREMAQIIKLISDSDRAQMLYQNKEIRFRLYSVQYLLFAVFLTLFTILISTLSEEVPKKFIAIHNFVTLILSPVMLILANSAFSRAQKMARILREATGFMKF